MNHYHNGYFFFSRFDVGAIENSKLYSSHAKISYSKGDFLDYLLKITRGANPSGQLKFILKDTIAANGQFKVTDSDGKGNGMVIVDFKKVRIFGNSNFKIHYIQIYNVLSY